MGFREDYQNRAELESQLWDLQYKITGLQLKARELEGRLDSIRHIRGEVNGIFLTAPVSRIGRDFEAVSTVPVSEEETVRTATCYWSRRTQDREQQIWLVDIRTNHGTNQILGLNNGWTHEKAKAAALAWLTEGLVIQE